MPKVKENPKAKKITMQVGDGPEVELPDNGSLETIRTYAKDLEDLASKKKVAKERLEEIEAGWPETAEVEKLTEELKAAKEQQKYKRLSSSTYVDQTETIAAITREEAEAKDILSDYLLNHFVSTHEKQVLMNEANGDAREINIKATLGRETKYQTSLDLSKD